MNMFRTLPVALTAAVCLVPLGTAFAGPSATVTATSAPNAAGSPSFAGWTDNAIQAQYLGTSSYGTVGTPTFYQAAPSTMSVYDNIVTGFNSWQGKTDPGTVFGAAFSNELGNRLHFALDLKAAAGDLVSIDKLSFTGSSSDTTDSLAFAYSIGTYGYSSSYRGLLYGNDGIRGTADDIWVTSGPSSQQVNEIIGRGSGNAWAVYTTDPGATLQDKIDNAALALGSAPINFTGQYSYDNQIVGSATVTFNPASVPDSGSTAALLVTGLAGLACLSRRRFRRRA